MNLLVVNCGSSTLKVELFAVVDRQPGKSLARGTVDRIGGDSRLHFTSNSSTEPDFCQSEEIGSHAQAMERVWQLLTTVADLSELVAVGHRVVHGGNTFATPVVVDREVLEAMEPLNALAPLHNPPALETLRRTRELAGANVPMVAVFDTAFHMGMPPAAAHYAIPRQWEEKYGIRRFGFHGLAHQYMAVHASECMGRSLDDLKLVTLQLGNGCSATAVSGGRSIDTSMGFTPLEGLIMGTRSGDLDPGILAFVAAKEKASPAQVEDWLNHRCGLLGISEASSDMRELLQLEENGVERAALAIAMFVYRVRKYIGAYLAVLQGADAIVFGGGIGEHSPVIRQRICAGLRWAGLELDDAANRAAVGREGRISSADSRLAAYVVPVDEAVIIARETLRLVAGR
ncbi:MAG: acetate kinase [Gemmatales bacterium]|nr:MAG: acetate kinase [Gemmatales bacterium]